VSAARRWLRSPWPLALAALLLAIALLSPRLPLPAQSWHHVVMVDITQSMNAVDMPGGEGAVARTEFVRRALRQAVTAMPCGSKLGLGVFTEYRALLLLTPLEVCSHYEELLAAIDRLDGRMAWAGASEVWRGLHSALKVVRDLPGSPSLVFVSDGHEAPPLRPDADTSADAALRGVRGAIAGVGGTTPVPIPKFDVDGHRIGDWEAAEVMQTDSISLGRTIGGAAQSLVDADGRPVAVLAGSGIEHLSSRKGDHLQALAQGSGLAYRAIDGAGDLRALLRDPQLAQTVTAPREVRALPTALALLLLGAALWPPRRLKARAAAPAGSAPAHR
jgi:mxaL protein